MEEVRLIHKQTTDRDQQGPRDRDVPVRSGPIRAQIKSGPDKSGPVRSGQNPFRKNRSGPVRAEIRSVPFRVGAGAQMWPNILGGPRIPNEKCCQGMPAKSHLEAYVSKQDFPNFDKI